MPNLSRRALLKYLAIAPIVGPTIIAANTSQAKYVKTFDISKYKRALLPREHGQLTDSQSTILRRYPSRDHCMQMAAFMNNNEALLIIGNDPKAAVCDWEIKLGRTLKIYYYDSPPEALQIKTSPSKESIAKAYREWATDQTWVKNRVRKSKTLDFISVASSSSVDVERNHIMEILDQVPGNVGVWFTQWRKFEFDRMYPDYSSKEPEKLSAFLSELHDLQRVTTMPYINGLLWDKNNPSFKIGNPGALLDSENDLVLYNEDLDFLKYACPSSLDWKKTIIAARNSLTDSRNRLTTGVYLDMMAAADPLLCWSNRHGHIASDPYSWKIGIRNILEQIHGSIMIEGCAEVYNDLIDYPLMHLYTDRPDSVSFWSLVYGDKLQSVGWKLPKNVSKRTFAHISKVITAYNVKAQGSPWMTLTPESELLSRGLPLRSVKPQPFKFSVDH